MTEKIVNEFGFDASKAIDDLARLDASLARLEQRLRSVGQATRQFNSGSRSFDRFSRSGVSAYDRLAQASRRSTATQLNAFDQLISANGRYTTSLALASRIVFTQAVIRGFRLVEQGAGQAARSFGELQKVLSEIKAISPDDTLDALAKSSQELSDAFNIPLLDVARGKYDLISNGFTKAADQQQVFVAAAKLGKLGVADQTQAIDLLSGALNAYGESAQQADKFARLFFQGANVGRFTIAQLSSNLGKAAPAAKSLGVEMEDLIALFSSLTVKGVSSPEAATQINSILAAFIKPSEGMTAALQKLGATSGQQLIKLRGFAGALQAVTATTDGSSVALAKLFPNVRALRGVLTEANDKFATLNTHLTSLSSLTQQEFESRLFDRMNTDAERASAAINKLKNAVTIGLGGGLVQTAAKLDRMTGKVDTLSTVVEKFFRVLTGHGLEDAAKGFDNLASRDIQATHDQLFKQLQDLDRIRTEVLDKARTSTTLPLGAQNFDDLKRTLDAALDLGKVRAYDAEIQKIIQHLEQTSRAREGANPALAASFNQQVEALKRVSQQVKVTDEDLRPILKGFQSIESGATGLNERLSFGPELKNAAQAMEDLLAKRALFKSLPLENLGTVQNALDQLNAAANSNAQNVSSALGTGAAAIEQAGQSAANSIKEAALGAAGQSRAKGGRVGYFANGGLARGTDTVPAMLTPGEFVVNKRSAQAFFPQLQAINAGVRPSFAPAGDTISNVVGDIIVNGAANPKITADEILSQLRRAFRRGTGQL